MRRFVTGNTLTILFLISAAAPAADWRPINPAELAQKTPRVESNADAEAIFWDIRIEDHFDNSTDLRLTLEHYIRIKIFTDLGREKYATVEIPRSGKRFITEVAARTIKANGSVIDVKKDSIFDRELVKTKGLKLKGTTFTFPNVEAGDMIEYRYKETRGGEIASYLRLYFQRELPLWSVTYHLKPLQLDWMPYRMRSMAFQCNHPPFEREQTGFYSTTMTNMPAFREEPNMPPEDQLRAWILIYYEEDKKLDAEKYWKEIGKTDFSNFKSRMSADGAVKKLAAELASGAAAPKDKLAAFDTFCRTKIKNWSRRASQMTADERKALKENHSPGDTLKQKAGSGVDIDLLFASLANAAGFDARMARIPDRGDTFFSKMRPTTYFIRSFSVAVNVDGSWIYYDPATPYLENGMLRWQEEGQEGLVSDPKQGFFASTQYTPPERSVRKRRASLKLLDDGTVEGTLQYTYTGQVSHSQKVRLEEMTPAEREEDWKDSLKSRLSTAEISDFNMKDVEDPFKPVAVEHKVSVPAYATRTGKRILLQPAFFQRNAAARFTESARKWDMYFDYAWTEDDEVTIELPAGWDIDKPVAPESSKIGDVGNYQVQVQISNDHKTLVYKRQFVWGRDNKLVLPAAAYQQVKNVFDFIQEQDNYTMALRAVDNAK